MNKIEKITLLVPRNPDDLPYNDRQFIGFHRKPGRKELYPRAYDWVANNITLKEIRKIRGSVNDEHPLREVSKDIPCIFTVMLFAENGALPELLESN